MSNAIQQFTVSEMQGMARAFVDSNMFGMNNVAGALSLLLIAQAEGIHPASAMRDYHVIQGKPALKADAMMARFQNAGGVVQWEEVSDDRAAAYFSHPTACPKPVLIEWTNEMVARAGLGGNAMHKKYPRQMKRARVISDGVRTTCPAVISGFYTPEEVIDFEPHREPPAELVKPVEVVDYHKPLSVKEAAAGFGPVIPISEVSGDGMAQMYGEEPATRRVTSPPTEPEAAAMDARINGTPLPERTELAKPTGLAPDTALTCGFATPEGGGKKKPVKKPVTEMTDGELEKARELACENLDDPKWSDRAKKAISLIEWEQATRIADAEAADLAATAAAKEA